MTLHEFAKYIALLGTDIVVNAGRNANETASVALATIVTGTPVDTGRARSNWVVSLGTPFLGSKLTAPFDKTGTSTVAIGNGVIAGRQHGPTAIYITNNLPYIQRLNEGWSAQAPAGYVQAAIQAAVVYVRNRKVLPR